MLVKIISIFLFSLSFLRAEEIPQDFEEIQADLSELSIQKDGIYYLFNGTFPLKVFFLQHKSGREYSVGVPRGVLEDIFGIWKCSYCGWLNSKFDSNCFKCGRPRKN